MRSYPTPANDGKILTIVNGEPAWGDIPPAGWGLTGNSGTTPGTNFIGTTDDKDLHLDVRNDGTLEQSLRMNTNQAIYRETGITVMSGFLTIPEGNARGQYAVDMQIYRDSVQQVGSGDWSTLSGGQRNTASGAVATVSGGTLNTASGTSTTVGGGFGNTASGNSTTVSGGQSNITSGNQTTIGGGILNTASNQMTTIGGGGGNTASGIASTVSGGSTNNSTGNYSTIGGGLQNTASGAGSVVSGGGGNTASGSVSTVSGGMGNTAQSFGETVIGIYATVGAGDSAEYVPTDRLFVIGNGLWEESRSDALVMLKNGNTTLNGTLTATGFSGSLSGNAATATSLQTARDINGVPFDGTANITLPTWNKTGNSGTTPGTDFIGTTDNNGLVFKVNNNEAGYISSDLNLSSNGNTSFGYQSLSAGGINTAIGYQAGRYIGSGLTLNSSGSGGVYIGFNTKASAIDNTNETVIGTNAVGHGNYSVTLGSNAVTRLYSDAAYAATSTSAPNMYVASDGQIMRSYPTPANDGKILTIVNGEPAWVSPSGIETDPVWLAAKNTNPTTITPTWTFNDIISDGSVFVRNSSSENRAMMTYDDVLGTFSAWMVGAGEYNQTTPKGAYLMYNETEGPLNGAYFMMFNGAPSPNLVIMPDGTINANDANFSGTVTLGSSLSDNIYVTGMFSNDGSAVTFGDQIIPDVDNLREIGASSRRWANVYATTFTGNLTGNVTGNVTGSVSGTASNVTGTVAIANGGTGATTANAAFNALAPTQASNSGKFLTTDGTDASWATVTLSESDPKVGSLSSNVIPKWGTTSLENSTIVDNGTNVTVTNNVLPGANDTYDIGATDARWANLWLGGETIHIGATDDEATISYNRAPYTDDRLILSSPKIMVGFDQNEEVYIPGTLRTHLVPLDNNTDSPTSGGIYTLGTMGSYWASAYVEKYYGLTYYGTTFIGNLTGNVTGDVDGNVSGTALNVTGTVAVANGGTGVGTATPYALVAAGTTATGNFQQVSGVGTSGQVLTSNGSNALPSWQNIPSPITTIIKSTDLSRSSNVLTADPDLQFSLSASTTYGFKAILYYGQDNIAADLIYRISNSGTTNSTRYLYKFVVPSASIFGSLVVQTAMGTTITLAGNTGTNGYIELDGIIEVATAGTFSFDWANNGNANNTTLYKLSSLSYWIIP
ncbi:MAG: hypothetical protein A2X64_02875 [Ignavibacteria bacterium GWF2_33_9]|nr:MAG: hypothetical protein A2X64_02875 [Ignavibacteria bacterium GWF2_33_9]